MKECVIEVNTPVYLSLLRDHALPWARESSLTETPEPRTARIRTRRRLTQQWCQNNFQGFWGQDMSPPSSADLSPMCFAIRSLLAADACATSYSSTAGLQQAPETAWSNTSEHTMRRCCLSVMRRMEIVVDIEILYTQR